MLTSPYQELEDQLTNMNHTLSQMGVTEITIKKPFSEIIAILKGGLDAINLKGFTKKVGDLKLECVEGEPVKLRLATGLIVTLISPLSKETIIARDNLIAQLKFLPSQLLITSPEQTEEGAVRMANLVLKKLNNNVYSIVKNARRQILVVNNNK